MPTNRSLTLLRMYELYLIDCQPVHSSAIGCRPKYFNEPAQMVVLMVMVTMLVVVFIDVRRVTQKL
jgi:hypothetical protein